MDNELKELHYFFKLGPKERLEQLRKTGKLYMKNLDYFINLETEFLEKGRGDASEASQMIIKRHELFINGEQVEIGPAPGIIRDQRYINSPVFCLMGKNILKNCIENNVSESVFKVDFDDRLLSDFSDESPPYVLVITDAKKFFNRIDKAINKLNIAARRGFINYRDKRIPNVIEGQLLLDDVFTKDLSFSHQEEYRILLDMEVEDYYELNIGSIEDISYIVDSSIIKYGFKLTITEVQ